jgi:hypothetical protein
MINMYEVIPFKAFVAGSISPSPSIFSMVDGGLTFFVGTGAVLLGMVFLEKMGIPINEAFVRVLMLSGILFSLLWTIFKNPLIRHTLIGF